MPGETEEEFSTRLANNLEELILKEGPDTVNFSITSFCYICSFYVMKKKNALTWYDWLFQIAAFIAEPVMGAGGVIPPPAAYFDKVNSLCLVSFLCFILKIS